MNRLQLSLKDKTLTVSSNVIRWNTYRNMFTSKYPVRERYIDVISEISGDCLRFSFSYISANIENDLVYTSEDNKHSIFVPNYDNHK